MGDVTKLIKALSSGDDAAADELYSLVYQNLKVIARKRMAGEIPGHTLQPTALVNEAYLRIVKNVQVNWQSRRHFYGVAAEAMRRILIESARMKKRVKRGGELNRLQFSDTCVADLPVADEWLDLDEALEELESLAPQKAELVKLKFFSGLTNPEIATTLNISKSTVERNWRFAKAWLKSRIRANDQSS